MQLVSTARIWEHGGELHYKAVRHAGDAPLGGFV